MQLIDPSQLERRQTCRVMIHHAAYPSVFPSTRRAARVEGVRIEGSAFLDATGSAITKLRDRDDHPDMDVYTVALSVPTPAGTVVESPVSGRRLWSPSLVTVPLPRGMCREVPPPDTARHA